MMRKVKSLVWKMGWLKPLKGGQSGVVVVPVLVELVRVEVRGEVERGGMWRGEGVDWGVWGGGGGGHHPQGSVEAHVGAWLLVHLLPLLAQAPAPPPLPPQVGGGALSGLLVLHVHALLAQGSQLPWSGEEHHQEGDQADQHQSEA